jgi:hypothetical protein
VQSSKASERVCPLSTCSSYGDTCYVLSRNHSSNTLADLYSKAPHIERLTTWLAAKGAGPQFQRCSDGFWRGTWSLLGSLQPIYSGRIRSRADGSQLVSSECEHPYRGIGNSILAMLSDAPRFWPYAFLSFPPAPHHDHSRFRCEVFSGRKPDLSRLRTLGCRVYVELLVLSLPRPHFLNLWISMCLIIPFWISALCPCPSPVKIRTSNIRAYLNEVQPLASATFVVSSSAPTLCRSRAALFILTSKPALLPPVRSSSG